ncbi:MAG: transglycosylase SLT domain-containing protein [Chitinivibrionales bacterium]|nr:transglycosylase SLT domain-containing protein [Chitinivibrionales bacterium]MBD3397303.1 transglycosylase SLT domain-containing protein [Chitinivibrionales bacterium]
MPYFYLEMIRGTETGRRYSLPDGAVSVGRSSRNTVAFAGGERSVSAHHAIIYKSPGRIMIQDLQSTNGTFVNGERVTDKELRAGDEVGFGAMGPRVKLIESETELPGAPPPSPAPAEGGHNTRARTVEDDRPGQRRRSRAGAKPAPSGSPGDSPSPADRPPSLTGEVERKLVERRASPDDMQALLKDGRRVEKLARRGVLGETHASMLLSAHHASRKTQKQWYIVMGATVAAALALIVFFAGRTYQYKKLVDRGLELEQRLDRYDRLIAQANADPDANRDKLRALIREFEEAGSELASVKGDIRDIDVEKFYDDTVEEMIAGLLGRFGETSYHVPAEMVDRVEYHLDVYSNRLRGAIGRYLERREKYLPMIHAVLAEARLPAELSYVAMLESGFNPNAMSHAGACGMWQFMKGTARDYGLRVERRIDERTDPEKSTRAAAEYFKDLIGIFGGKSSVMLAMAAYNAGERRIERALRKIEDPMRNRDFWYIYRMGYLAEETNEYIPRVFALMIIVENPEKYGFKRPAGRGPVETDLEAADDFVEFSLDGEYGR